MSKRAGIFFDRDNTLIATDGYLGDPDRVQLIDGAAEAVARAHELGYAVVIISNQSGVARGMYTEEAVHAVNTRLAEMLQHANPRAIIDRHEFCPFHPDATVERYRLDSDLRKPRPGMLIRAAKMLELDLGKSWVIGDAPRDIEAGQAAKCKTILFRSPDIAASPASEAVSDAAPDATVTTLAEAMAIISKETPKPEGALPVETQAPAAIAPAASPTPSLSKSVAAPESAPVTSVRMEKIAEQILYELRRRNDQNPADFSVSKLMAGVAQAIALAALIGAYFLHDRTLLEPWLLVALTLQTLTVSLLIMGNQHR